MAQAPERDFPIGHPAAADTVIGSAAHRAWERLHQFEENRRDFPPGHPKAIDTPGNTNQTAWEPGVDPLNPHHQAFTGHPPQKAAAVAEWNEEQAAGAHESPVLPPVDATVANAALEAERKRLGVDSLTADQHAAVIAALHNAAPAPAAPAAPAPAAPIRLTLDQVHKREAAGTMPDDWWPTTGKPWYGPAD